MKLLFAVFVSTLALSAQDPQSNPPVKKPAAPKASAKPAPKAAAKPAPVAPVAPKVTDGSKPMPIPAQAVLAADGDYHYTDPQGKKWIYRKTPFGVTRMEDTPQLASANAVAAAGAFIKATEDGDTVRFERQGPFGVWKWEKKKSELDEAEKAALANAQANNKTASK
jgi:hypothetical protein